MPKNLHGFDPFPLLDASLQSGSKIIPMQNLKTKIKKEKKLILILGSALVIGAFIFIGMQKVK